MPFASVRGRAALGSHGPASTASQPASAVVSRLRQDPHSTVTGRRCGPVWTFPAARPRARQRGTPVPDAPPTGTCRRDPAVQHGSTGSAAEARLRPARRAHTRRPTPPRATSGPSAPRASPHQDQPPITTTGSEFHSCPLPPRTGTFSVAVPDRWHRPACSFRMRSVRTTVPLAAVALHGNPWLPWHRGTAPRNTPVPALPIGPRPEPRGSDLVVTRAGRPPCRRRRREDYIGPRAGSF